MTLYQVRQSVTLSNNTTKDVYLSVPLGKKWIIHAIMMRNGDDVNRDLSVKITDGSNNVIHVVSIKSSASPNVEYTMCPFQADAVQIGTGFKPIIKGGNKLLLRWAAGGTSSGGTGYYGLTYEEVPE